MLSSQSRNVIFPDNSKLELKPNRKQIMIDKEIEPTDNKDRKVLVRFCLYQNC